MRSLWVLFILIAISTVGCISQSRTLNIEDEFILRSGGLETLYMHPLRFGEQVWVSFHETETGQFGFCLHVNGSESCGEIEREPTPIYIAEISPHCEGEPLALSLALVDATDDTIEIYYVGGVVTQDREEAEQLVREFPNCEIGTNTLVEAEPHHDMQQLEFPETGSFMAQGCPDCTMDRFQFAAYSGDEMAIDGAISGNISTDTDGQTTACLTYFGDERCTPLSFTWHAVWIVELSFPCGSHTQGFLIEGKGPHPADDQSARSPSLWLAYANGEVAAIEGETPEALSSMFVCSGE